MRMIVVCSECNKKVSTNASSCPHCGSPIQFQYGRKEKEPYPSKGKGGIFKFVFVIIVLFYIVGQCGDSKKIGGNSTSWKSKDNSGMAHIMIQEFVRKRLKSPSTADFPSYYMNKEMVHYAGNQTYSIKSYVDSQNGFGATIRTKFFGELKQTSKDNWKLNLLELY